MQIWFNYLDQILAFAMLAVSLNLLLGYAGQVSVAHAAFGAVGGYTMGYLVQLRGWSFLPAVAAGIVLAFVLGMLVALPALKLSVEYLILLTLAVSSVIIGVIIAAKSLGGTNGLIAISGNSIFGFHLNRPSDWIAPLAVGLAIVYAICWRMGESPYGRVLKGLREDPLATQALGKNVFKTKVIVFAVTSALAGFAGGMYSGWYHLATPGLYGFNFSLTIFAIVIFGGMANLTGSVLGAAIIVLLEPFLRRTLKLSADKAFVLQLVIYGVLLALLMRLRPQGVFPEGFSLWRRLRHGKKTDARVEMNADTWVPDTHVSIKQADHDPTHNEQIERERRWREAPVVLQARGISKSFGGIVAAEDLDIDLRKGTITALVGPNGAGKTTVFNLLTGFIRPDSGSVTMNGQELVGRTPDAVARLGLVRSFQDVRLIQRVSCLQNVMLAVQNQPGEHLTTLFVGGSSTARGEQATHEKAMEWLTFVGMADFAEVPAGALSYGQSKLLSLARVLATEADVLLLDEPASGIDTKWVDTMLDLIEAVREQGRTVCIVEHNLHVVGRLADHTYFMELGRITAQGTIDELTSSPRLAEAYFGS
jgi:branched-chain amino acid transport system permease protein